MHLGLCYILLLTGISIVGCDINEKTDNESKELHKRGSHLFFIPTCFERENVENYIQ